MTTTPAPKKVRLTREFMIDKIKADDIWLNRAVLTLLDWHEKNNKFLTLSHFQYLEYCRKWMVLSVGVVATPEGHRNLTGKHRDKAVAVVTEHRNLTVLYAIAAEKAAGSTRSADDKANIDKQAVEFEKMVVSVTKMLTGKPPLPKKP